MSTFEPNPSKPLIVIVGAGVGGISAALALQKQLKYDNFLMFDKAKEVGGTWRENTYPGCGCDVPSHWYSISNEPNPNWSATYSPQPEILEYLKDVTKRNKLKSHIRFGHRLITADWDDKQNLYKCFFEVNQPDGSKTTEVHLAQIFINCTGGLHVPKLPDIKGLSTFKGDTFHSAQWRHDIELKHKTVGIIGNGCSSCQIVPTLARDPKIQIVNFCRTPAWFAPRAQTKYSGLVKWMFKYVPFVHKMFRFFIYATADLQYMAWIKGNFLLRRAVEAYMRRYIAVTAPPHLVKELTPNYSFGCKRVIRDPGYLASLGQPNVSLTWDAIEEVVPEGIITKGGKLWKLDVLIPATGFDVTAASAPPVRGIGGKSVGEWYSEQGGPTAYLGTTMPGFPNMFSVLGPNVASGHASAIFVEESAVNYIMKMIKPILAGEVAAVNVKDGATDAYNDDLQKRMNQTVWMSCSSYYNQEGGKNVAMYPGFATTLWWKQLTPNWSHYIVTKASEALGGTTKRLH